MITIELNPKHLEYLTEQAAKHGRFGLLIEADDGEIVSVVLNSNHRRSHKAKPKPETPDARP